MHKSQLRTFDNHCTKWVSFMSQHFYFVTDQGSNIKAALSGKYQRLACACHVISTSLKHALPSGPGDKGESEDLQGLQQVIDDVKGLVRYIKKSGLNAALTKSVVQENDTRWNSMLLMLDSVIAQEHEITEALKAKGESQRIENVDFSLLKQFTAFLQPLKVATKLLEGDSFPTIQQVVLQKEQELSYHRETARQLPTWRGLGPPAHSPSAPSGYTYVYGQIRKPQRTYVKRAVH